MFIPAVKNAPFYVLKKKTIIFSLHLTSIVNIGVQYHPCGGGQVAKAVPGQLCAGGG